jgi:hypothetical protein
MNRYERLKQILGMNDAGDAAAFRTSASLVTATAPELATTDEEKLKRINASGYVQRELKSDDVYVHTIEAASDRFIPDRFAFLGESTLRNIAADALKGFSVITHHRSGGIFSEGQNPYGRTFAAAVDRKDGRTRVLVQFYMLRDHSPNGSAAPSTDDMDKGIVGGTLFDVSAGLKRGPSGRLVCDVCKLELFSSCQHWPGTIEGLTAGEIERQKARGVPNGVATFTFDDFHAKECSFVVDGAIADAGTALSDQSHIIAPTRAQEDSMYTKELKIKLGLSENATDAEVEAKLSAMSAAAQRATDLEAQIQRNADAAFDAKVKDKLTDAEIAQIRGLSNRDAVADMLLAAKNGAQRATPVVGNPLAGAASAAATPGQPQLTEFEELSEQARTEIGVFTSKADLDKYALMSPFEAIKKFFGAGFNARPDGEFTRRDQRIVDQRKRVFQVA